MSRPGQIDHVAVGLAEVPEKLRADRVSRYLAVYLQRYNFIEEVAQQVVEGFLAWNAKGNEKDIVLETIGALFDTPRPTGFSNTQYAFILGARAIARQSNATQADVYRLALYLSEGREVKVFRIVPKIVQVVFVDLQATPTEQAVYARLLLDAVDAVDRLDVQFVSTGTAFYDVGAYDSELYAP